VSRIVLLSLDVGFDIGRRHETYCVPERLEFARPVMRRCAGLNADEAWRQLLEECQDIPSLQLAADHHLAYRVDAVDLKNRLRDVETDRRDAVHAALLRIVVTPAATTSMALTCRWRSRPQHQKRTCLEATGGGASGASRHGHADRWLITTRSSPAPARDSR